MIPSLSGQALSYRQDGDQSSNSKPLPKINPCLPILPEAGGISKPTEPTEKLIQRATPRSELYERSIVGEGITKTPSPYRTEVLKKGAAAPGDSRVIDTLSREIERLRAENTFLTNDRSRFSIGNEGNSDNDDIHRLKLRLADLEAANRNSMELYEQEKKTTDSFKVLLKVKEGEQIPQMINEGIKRRVLDYEHKNMLFMIEIERLGGIVAELQQENDRLIEKLTQNGVKNNLQAYDSDKFLLQNQIREYKIKIDDLERRLATANAQPGQSSSLLAEVDRLNNDLREKNNKISDLEIKLISEQAKSHGEQVKRAVLPDQYTTSFITPEYDTRVNDLIREKEDLAQKVKKLENERLVEVQNVLNKNEYLSKQNALLAEENSKILFALKDLESEQSHMGSRFQQLSKDLEDIQKKKAGLTPSTVELSSSKIALKNDVSTKIQNGIYEPTSGLTQASSSYPLSYSQTVYQPTITTTYTPAYTTTQYVKY